jgi:hypothetical protein
MTDQQLHLQNLTEQQNNLIKELQDLNNAMTSKRDLLLKVQGAIEYLQQTGVTLPEPESEEVAEVSETEVA